MRSNTESGTAGRGAVLITGASTGIGRTAAMHLDRLGFRVFAGVRQRASGMSIESESTGHLTPVTLDVTDPASVTNALEHVHDEVGHAGLVGLVNNAGIPCAGPLEYLALEDVRQVFEVNVLGQIAVTQAFLPLVRAGGGRIVFTGSVSGRIAMPFLGPYAASKHALEAIVESLRRELLPWRIHVSILEPGNIATEIWDKGLDPQNRADLLPGAERLYGRALDFADSEGRRAARMAIDPSHVAKAIEHALTAKHPKRRYVVGLDAQLLINVGSRVPRLIDAALTRTAAGRLAG